MRLNAKQNKLSVSRLVYSIVSLMLMLMMLITASHAWLSNRLTSQMQNTEEYITIDADAGLQINYGDQDSSDGSIEISSNVKLTECSSADGKNFFFPLSEYQDVRATSNPEEDPDAPTDNPDGDFVDNAGTKDFIYRKSTANDKNTKYISIDLSLKSKDPTKVYLSSDSHIKGNASNAIRVAFIENVPGGNSVIFDNSTEGYGEEYWAIKTYKNNSPSLEKCIAKTFQGYAFNTPLFQLDANEERSITVNIWLEGTDKDCTKDVANSSDLDIKIKFSTSVEKQDSIKFIDHTIEKWVDDDGCNVFAIDTDGTEHPMDPSSEYTWSVSLPKSIEIAKFVRYNPDKSKGKPEEWNYWYAGASGDCKTYNAVGHSAGLWMDDLTVEEIRFFDGSDSRHIIDQVESNKIHIQYTVVDGNGNEVTLNYKMSYLWESGYWRIAVPSKVSTITYMWGDAGDEFMEKPTITWTDTERGSNRYFTAFINLDEYTGYGYWGNKLLYLHGSNYLDDDYTMFAAYFYGDYSDNNGNNFIWTSMHATTKKGRYVAVVPDGTNGVVFCSYVGYSGWWDWENVGRQTPNSLEKFGNNNLLKLSGYNSDGTLNGTWYYSDDP